MIYKTAQNDRIDLICYKHYGFLRGSVEAVLEANPVATEYFDYLPEGLELYLPELPRPTDSENEVRIFD